MIRDKEKKEFHHSSVISTSPSSSTVSMVGRSIEFEVD